MKKLTLEEIIKEESERRCESGMFGIRECKEHIKFEVEYFKKNMYELLGDYVERANNDIFFNRAMVLACWELINNR